MRRKRERVSIYFGPMCPRKLQYVAMLDELKSLALLDVVNKCGMNDSLTDRPSKIFSNPLSAVSGMESALPWYSDSAEINLLWYHEMNTSAKDTGLMPTTFKGAQSYQYFQQPTRPHEEKHDRPQESGGGHSQ